MIYTQRDKLTIVNLNNMDSTISFDKLVTAMLDRPSNMIYCEAEGKLYGIISMGDIARACEQGADHVVINRNFTQIQPNAYMTARNIFHKKQNINALPIVNEDNELLGE